jgi:hypothetical protein
MRGPNSLRRRIQAFDLIFRHYFDLRLPLVKLDCADDSPLERGDPQIEVCPIHSEERASESPERRTFIFKLPYQFAELATKQWRREGILSESKRGSETLINTASCSV